MAAATTTTAARARQGRRGRGACPAIVTLRRGQVGRVGRPHATSAHAPQSGGGAGAPTARRALWEAHPPLLAWVVVHVPVVSINVSAWVGGVKVEV